MSDLNSLYSKGANLTTTTETTLFTVPSKYIAVCTNAFVSNHGGSTNTVSLWWSKPDGTDIYLIEAKSLASKDFIKFGEAGSLVLQAGHSMKTQTGSAGDVGVFVTFHLLPYISRFNSFNGE